MPDHVGPAFAQKEARVAQLEIYDINDKLVPPWRIHEVLKPGTFIATVGTVMAWHPKVEVAVSIFLRRRFATLTIIEHGLHSRQD